MGKKPRKKFLPAKTKVVHLITLLELGGAQGNTIYTANHLSSDRYEVHLWSGKGAFWDNEVERTWGKTERLRFFPRLKRSIHPLYDFWVIWDLSRALKKLKPKILHTHSSKAGIVGRIAGRIAGVPHIIHTYHGFGFNNRQKPWSRFVFITLEKVCARFTEKIIFVSESNRNEAKDLHIGTPEQYLLIRSGIPLHHLINKAAATNREGGKRSLGLNEGPVVVTIGAFKPQKNLTDFLLMAKEVETRIPPAHFLIIGDGQQRAMLEAKAAELGLTNKVIFLGWRQDIPQLLALADAFVLTSLWEGLPRALVEAMALGIPSFCYETDGVKDILTDSAGAIVSQGDWKRMALSIVETLQSPEKQKAFSIHAKQVIGIEFDIDHMVEQLDSLYQTLLLK